MLRKKLTIAGLEPDKAQKGAVTSGGKPRTPEAAKKAANRAAIRGERSAGKGAR
jgi:hypothetical protein